MAGKYGAMRAAAMLAIPFSSIRRWSSQCKNGVNVSCAICGKSFLYNSALNWQIEIAHKDEKHKSLEGSQTKAFKEEVAKFATKNTSTIATAKYNVADTKNANSEMLQVEQHDQHLHKQSDDEANEHKQGESIGLKDF